MASSLVCSCEDASIVDPRELATLVIKGEIEFNDQQKQALANAAESWNLEFGTRLVFDVEGRRNVEQPIAIEFSDDACVNDRGQRTHARATAFPPSIRLCPETGKDLLLTYESVRHELGHIVGIPTHVKDNDTAVMTGVATAPFHWFQIEDRRLFHSSNPVWQGETGCAVSPWIGYGRPKLTQPAGHPIQLIWAAENAIQFAPVDSTTADIGGVAGEIMTSIEARDLEAHPTRDGFLVTWFEENRINLSPVELPAGVVGQTHAVELEWPASSFYKLSAVHASPYYWLAVTVRDGLTNSSRTLHVIQMDDSTGAILRRLEVPNAHGQILLHHDETFLVTGQLNFTATENVVRLRRLEMQGDELVLGEGIDLARVAVSLIQEWALPEPILAVQSSRMGILVLLERKHESGSIQLVRVGTDGTLAINHTVALPTGLFFDPVIVEADEDLFVGGSMTQPDHYQPEVYFAQLSVHTLAVRRTWRRLSAPDGLPSSAPRLAVEGDQLVAVWDEANDEMRSRCVTIE
jgi:hypothetical protein